MIDFDKSFHSLTGNRPFPWQRKLYDRFVAGDIPASCNLPTGLGKTAVMPIWLIALAGAPSKTPRRLVFVVNRRTVVDEATIQAERMRQNLFDEADLAKRLMNLCASDCECPLAISTLRGPFADDAEWRADPARPAVIVGTVGMIGSRLLFSGYGCCFRSRPVHAGLLGQDVLLVHDDAHLEPAFRTLLDRICEEQALCGDLGKICVMNLSSTERTGETFGLTREDEAHDEVRKRIRAKKHIEMHRQDDEKKTANEVIKRALAHRASKQAILIFLRKVEDVERVAVELPRGTVERLTGTLRGLERDRFATENSIFVRFMSKPDRPVKVTPATGTVYLICTAAGEVAVNISADHLVCDLAPFDSMAQRFGRVNRFGDGDARIDLVHPTSFDANDPYDAARDRTLTLMRLLNGDGSPAAIRDLPAIEREAAFTPPPIIRPAPDILFDAWALTTVREEWPGRPPVAEWLYGVEDEKQLETSLAWREEVAFFQLPSAEIENYLNDYPIKPHELLTEQIYRVLDHLKTLAKADGKQRAWLIDSGGTIRFATVSSLAALGGKALFGSTVVLPPAAGGLSARGTLDGKEAFTAERKYDVADEFTSASARLRVRFLVSENGEERWRLLGCGPDFPARPDASGRLRGMARLPVVELDKEDPRQFMAFVEWKIADGDETRSRQAPRQQNLDDHLIAAGGLAARIADQVLRQHEQLRTALVLAARWHDLGKHRDVWQRSIDNPPPKKPLAKSGASKRLRELEGFRHEFASLVDLLDKDMPFHQTFLAQLPDIQDLILHLIAAHHGRGRPHFPVENAFDPEKYEALWSQVANEVPRRFARLQRTYGRWGMAYLEALLRAADILASRMEDL